MAIKQTTSEIVPIGAVVTDGGTQARARLDQSTVDAYASDMESGAIFPPITVFYDGDKYWLADGFHRFAAHKSRGNSGVSCDVRPGTRRDALLFAAGANATNGLRRTNEDKRRAVQMLLGDDEWAKKSDRWIAEKCGVNQSTVSRLRPTTDAMHQLPRQGQDGKTRKQPSKPKAPPTDKNPPTPTPPVIPDPDFPDDEDPPPLIPPAPAPAPAPKPPAFIGPAEGEDEDEWEETQAHEPSAKARDILDAIYLLSHDDQMWILEMLGADERKP